MRSGVILVIGLFLVSLTSGCKDRCVDCTIEHFLDLSVIAEVNDMCGDEDELAVAEANLSVDYRCVQCVVFLTTGNYDTGILCGTREYTDSVEQSNSQAAMDVNAAYSCEFMSDTLIITCHPSQD